ncbi:MAG: hypothetical protein Q9191_001112 [Dirinaria sp. TL-2023a]
MLLTSIPLLLSLIPTVSSASCNADICLRALKANTYYATDFCRSYTSATPPTPSPTIAPLFASPCASSPQRASSACTCVVPKQTGCVPTIRQDGELLKNTDFSLNDGGSQASSWELSVTKAANQPTAPEAHYDWRPYSNDKDWHLNLTFPATGVTPDTSLVTLKQDFQTLCSGSYRIYLSSVFYSNDSKSNCTITTGIEGYPASFYTYNFYSFSLDNQGGKLDHWNDFTLEGVPSAGTAATFSLKANCPSGSVVTLVEIDDVQLTYRFTS